MKQLLLFLLLVGLTAPLWSQQFPVESQIVVRPPSSVYLSDFTEPGSQRLEFLLDFRDGNEPDYDVRLHLRLEGNGVVLETSPNYQPPPLTLFPGGPRSIDLFEWSEYLNPANLNLVGLDQTQFLTNGGKLPEGMYQLCLTVRDYRRPDVDLSRENCTVLNLRKNNPPQAFVPTCGGVVQPNPNNQVQLVWQANHDALVNAQYTIDFVKVEPDQDPNQAILSGSQRLLPEVAINNQTSYNIDPSDPMSTPLVFGETYAYRINVTDLDGLTTFENDGQGEVCWFSYGFLPGGVLGINYPLQDNRVNPSQPLTFNWNGPSNVVAGTQVYYKLRVADVTDGTDPEAALQSAALLIDEQTPPTSNLGSWNFTYDGELETERQLAWIVEAYAEGSEGDEPLASSEVTVFRTTPLIDKFRAGQYTVFVNTAGNSTIDNFSGTGTVQVNDTLSLEVAFENLVIEQLSTANVLLEGVIDHPLNEEWPLENEDGGSYFLANRLLLDRNDLKLAGQVRHLFNLPGESVPESAGPLVIVQSPELLLNFEAGVFDAGSGTFDDIDIKPFDLPGLTIEYREMTYEINEGRIDYVVNGTYRLSGALAYLGQESLNFPFSNQTSFYDQEVMYRDGGKAIRVTSQDTMLLVVKELGVDLRYDDSAAETGEEDIWVGFYVKDGAFKLPTNFDADGAIVPLQDVAFELSELEAPVLFTPLLNLSVDHTFPQSNRPRASFYNFLDDWHRFTLVVDGGSVTNGSLTGDVYVPFLDQDTPFDYSVTINGEGSEAAWLAGIDGYVLDLEGRENVRDELSITINSGAFAGNDRLVLDAEVYFSAFDATLSDLSGLTLWGDGGVGFDGVRHGIKESGDHIEVNVNNFPGNLKNFGISYQLATETEDDDAAAPPGLSVWQRRIKYLFVYEADVNFGMFLSSLVPGNAPKSTFSLSTYRDIDVLLEENHESDLDPEATTMPDEWTDLWEAQQAQEDDEEHIFGVEGQPEMIPFLIASVATSAIPGVANVTVGKLQIVPDDPDWGAFFALKSEIEMQRPFAFRIQIDVFAGHTPWIDQPDGYAYTMVKLGLKDGTEGFYQNLDNHLAAAKTRNVLLGDVSNSLSEGTNISNPLTVGPISLRYLAVGVYINMDYNGSGKLVPTQGSYGGLLSISGRMNIPPGSDDGLGQALDGASTVGKRRVQIDLTAEVIVSTSLGFSYVYGKIGVNYTENVNSDDASQGGNYVKASLEGSYDWGSQLMVANAEFDMWYPPLCIVANAGFEFQLYPESGDLRRLNVRVGSYENRVTVEYCQAVEAGSDGSAGASVGYSYGLVAWLDFTFKYGLPSPMLPADATSFASIDEDLAALDEQIAALNALPQSEREIIETALTNPDDLPEEITNDPDFQEQLIEFESTYGTKVLSGEIGLGATASVEARANDWIDLAVVRFIPFVQAEAQLVAWGNAQIIPVFVLNEIGVELSGTANIGVYYEQLDGLSYTGNVQTWTAAAITLFAQGIWDVPGERIYGSLSATVQLISLPTGGYLIEFTGEVDYDFSLAEN